MHDSNEASLYYGKMVNGNFDLILTNPPFSVNLDNDTKKTIKKSFIFGEKKNSENRITLQDKNEQSKKLQQENKENKPN